MKKIAKMLALVALMCAPAFAMAQADDFEGKLAENTAISQKCEQEIEITQAEIKVLKLKMKYDGSNVELPKQLQEKENYLAEQKASKKRADSNVKDLKASLKADAKAKKAQAAAEAAAAKAQAAAEKARNAK